MERERRRERGSCKRHRRKPVRSTFLRKETEWKAVRRTERQAGPGHAGLVKEVFTFSLEGAWELWEGFEQWKDTFELAFPPLTQSFLGALCSS